MPVDSVHPARLLSDNRLTYEVEEVAEGAIVAVVGEGGGKIIHSLSRGGTSASASGMF